MSTQPSSFKVDPSHFGVRRDDGGWIYAVRTGQYVKVGKTTDPSRRLLREAKTWCPEALDEIIAKPFWDISRLEYSLHAALAEHWHRGEWHKFEDPYWLSFFLDAFREFKDGEDERDRNSVDFIYWMNGTNYSEIVSAHCESNLSLRQWQKCRADPWAPTREEIRAALRTR
ncbi:hypothetical protein V1281_002880 [Nitrobacteraceae bacterium AZCC 2161]